MAELLVLSRADLKRILSLEETIAAVEEGFISYAQKSARIFPVVREPIPEFHAMFGMKSGYIEKSHLLGTKIAGYWPGNRENQYEPHQAIIILLDPATGVPYFLSDGNYITQIRTAAAGSLALQHLARKDASVAAILGTGVQGQGQAAALLTTLKLIKEIRLFDPIEEAVQKIMKVITAINENVSLVHASTPEEAVRGAEVVITCTPSQQMIVKSEWIEAGTHISAFGADTKGKQELDPELFTRAKIVVDDTVQARALGDTQHAVNKGLIKIEDIHAELGEILSGKKSGRTSSDEITIFDATGLSVQDLAAAGRAFELAKKKKIGTHVEI
ncbi:MAG: ornithine cyclodeaminase family protein [Chloroflexi bacterium]|nr:ornithine cyclodeaminase family protein [Chloroflexota bacterium]